MSHYFYPGKEEKAKKKKKTKPPKTNNPRNFRAGGHDSKDFIPRLQRRFRCPAGPGLAVPAGQPAVTCPPEAPGAAAAAGDKVL